MLIATDCLSEGINLQDGFTAVVHYDLAWNPTRHEQREGRVDRFGQLAPTVRAVTYYGEDNGIDGIVLDVLIRRHEKIKRSTGVSVPVPVDSTTVMKAIWESLLLRGTEPEQLDPRPRRGHHQHDRPTPSEAVDQRRRTGEGVPLPVPAGRHCKPDAVEAALADVRRSLGGPADAESFTRDALSPAVRAARRHRRRVHRPHRHPAPRGARPAARPPRSHRLRFHRSLPAPPGDPVLTRTDPTVEALARYVLDAALDPQLPDAAAPGPARRRHPHHRRAQRHHPAGGPLPRRARRARLAHAPSPRSPRTPSSWPSPPPATTSTWLDTDRDRRAARRPRRPATSTTTSPAPNCSRALDRLPDLHEHLDRAGKPSPPTPSTSTAPCGAAAATRLRAA